MWYVNGNAYGSILVENRGIYYWLQHRRFIKFIQFLERPYFHQ